MGLLQTIKAIAWDVDGTLIDSEPVHAAALQLVCDDWRVDISDVGTHAFMGVAMLDVWRCIGERFPYAKQSDGEQRFYQGVTDAYLSLIDQLQPRAGALQTIERLAQLGVMQCAVSNSEGRIVQANLAHLEVSEFMAFTVTLDTAYHPKPNPAPYLQSCAQMGLCTHQMMAVEDSATGLRSAHQAGVVSVLYAIEEHWREWQDDASLVIHALPELVALFETSS